MSDPAGLDLSVDHSPFHRLIGLVLVRAEDGVVEMRLPWQEAFGRSDPVELAAPRFGEARSRAAARAEKEPAMTQIFSEIRQLRLREDKVIMAVHKKERRFK